MDNEDKKVMSFIVFMIFLVISIVLLMMSITVISAGERGVLLEWGKPKMDPLGEGIHFKLPIRDSVKKLEVRTLKVEENADAASRDLQDVQTLIALNYHLVPELTPALYQEVGPAYIERIIKPAIQESVKSITAQFTAEELVTKRPTVRKEMMKLMDEKLSKYHISVDDFNIVDFQFSEEFDAAIEKKVTAEQKKLTAERDLERIKIEKEQKITQAEAEAESLRLKKQQITPELVNLKQIEVAEMALEVQKEAIDKWNGNLPYVTGGANPFIELNNLHELESLGSISDSEANDN